MMEGFTKKYGLKCLVYIEEHATALDAIQREKQLKNWRRAWKVRLVLAENPDWEDLYERLA